MTGRLEVKGAKEGETNSVISERWSCVAHLMGASPPALEEVAASVTSVFLQYSLKLSTIVARNMEPFLLVLLLVTFSGGGGVVSLGAQHLISQILLPVWRLPKVDGAEYRP